MAGGTDTISTGPEGGVSIPSVEAPKVDTGVSSAPVTPEVSLADTAAAALATDPSAALEKVADAPVPVRESTDQDTSSDPDSRNYPDRQNRPPKGGRDAERPIDRQAAARRREFRRGGAAFDDDRASADQDTSADVDSRTYPDRTPSVKNKPPKNGGRGVKLPATETPGVVDSSGTSVEPAPAEPSAPDASAAPTSPAEPAPSATAPVETTSDTSSPVVAEPTSPPVSTTEAAPMDGATVAATEPLAAAGVDTSGTPRVVETAGADASTSDASGDTSSGGPDASAGAGGGAGDGGESGGGEGGDGTGGGGSGDGPKEEPDTDEFPGGKTPEGKKTGTRKTKAEKEAEAVGKENLDPAKAARRKELTDKLARGEKLTPDEAKELNGLNKEMKNSPEARQAMIEEKLKNGEPLTDDEESFYAARLAGEVPEPTAAELAKQIEDMGTEMMLGVINGKGITIEQLQKLWELQTNESMVGKGFTPEQARKAIREATQRNPEDRARQSEKLNELKDKIEELMKIEWQILAVPKTVDALRKQRRGIQAQADAAHKAAEAAYRPEDRLTKKTQEYNLYMQIANINAEIIRNKHLIPVLDAHRRDLEQYVRRKVGITSLLGLEGFMEFGNAKINNVVTGIGVDISEELDYRFGKY